MVPRISPDPVPLPVRVRCRVSGLETPRMVNVPWTSKVSGPVCTIWVERNVINGSCSTLKKSSLFSVLSLSPLPVFTLAAWIFTSNTALSAAGDVNVRDASHWSNVPSMATDADTWNLIVLSTGVILNTGTAAGACAPTGVVKRLNAARQTITTGKPTAVFAECMACLLCGTLLWHHERFEVVLGWRWWQHARYSTAAACAQPYHPTAQPTTSGPSRSKLLRGQPLSPSEQLEDHARDADGASSSGTGDRAHRAPLVNTGGVASAGSRGQG